MNVTQIDVMIWTFSQPSVFNQDMSKSDVDKVTNVSDMFSEVITFFNQDLSYPSGTLTNSPTWK